MSLLLSWLVLSLAVWLTATLLPGFHVRSFKSAVIVAAIFGLLNFFLGWLIFGVLAVVTLGLFFETGDDGYFRVEGHDPALPEQDCLPGLPGGLALYGGLPGSVASLAGLAGQELPFEFSGDGDDANLCFVGSNGLLGVETGTVRFTAVDGSKVTFTFSGSFAQYDGEGGREPLLLTASGSGVAHVVTY